jgi:hypothetical protein
MADVFGQAGTDAEVFAAQVAALSAQLSSGGMGLTVDLRSAEELNGALGAYAAVGHTGEERIYLNADWIAAGASALAIRQVLLEEAGHAIDQRLNLGADSPGDEGQLFATVLLRGDQLSIDERLVLDSEVDAATLMIDGQLVSVELALGGNDAGTVKEDGLAITQGVITYSGRDKSIRAADS